MSRFIITALLFFSLLLPGAAFAQAKDYVLLSGGVPGFESGVVQTANASDYLPEVFNLFIGISAALAVVMFVVGGFEYLMGETVGTKSDGKGRMLNAIYGLLLILVAYLFLHTINPSLVNLDFKLAPVIDRSKPDTSNIQVPSTVNISREGFEELAEAEAAIKRTRETNPKLAQEIKEAQNSLSRWSGALVTAANAVKQAESGCARNISYQCNRIDNLKLNYAKVEKSYLQQKAVLDELKNKQ